MVHGTRPTLLVAALAVWLAACGGLVHTQPANEDGDGAGASGGVSGSGASAGTQTSGGEIGDAGGADVAREAGDAPSSSPDSSPPPPAAEVLFTGNPVAFAQDAENLYWVDGQARAIMTMDKATRVVTTLASGLSLQFPAIAVDDNSVYWTEGAGQSDGTIRKMPKGGGDIVTIISGQGGPSSLAIESSTLLYWTNYIDGTVSQARTNGEDTIVNARNNWQAAHIAVPEFATPMKICWTTGVWPNMAVVSSEYGGEFLAGNFYAPEIGQIFMDGAVAYFIESENNKATLYALDYGATNLTGTTIASGPGGSYPAPVAVDHGQGEWNVWLSWFGGDGLVKISLPSRAVTKLQPEPYGDTAGATAIVVDDARVYWVEPHGGVPEVIKSLPKKW